MKQITEIRCSGLSRPMSCAGSLFFENLPEQETNEAAKEGTAVGEYLATLLVGKQVPFSVASNGVVINDEMIYYANEAYNEIKARAQSEILCETRIDWTTRSGITIKGSYDIAYEHEDCLVIDDLKYGWNLVEVFENWQLLGYAIGEIIRRQKYYPTIVLRIIQPRPHHEEGSIREWRLTYDGLLAYKEQIESRMDKIAAGFNELVTSKKCKYCPAAAAACTAFNRAVFHGIDYVMDHFQQDNLSEKEIAFQLDLLDRVTEILKIKTDSLNQLAVSKVKEGVIIPSWILEDKLSDRKWKSNVSPKVIETLTGVKITEEIMLSPAKAEKLGVSKDLVAKYVDRKFLGQKLVKKDSTNLANKIFGTNKPN